MREHLVLASESGHLNYEAGWNLRTNYKKKNQNIKQQQQTTQFK